MAKNISTTFDTARTKHRKLAEKAETPALIVVGEVVKLHEQLAWFGEEKQRQKQPHFTLESLSIDQVA